MTVNAGGWATVVDSLALGIYDIVLVQETWLLEGSVCSAAFKGGQMGYEGEFTPACKDKTLGRGKGGEAGELHACAQSLYGWVDNEFATRQVILEVAERAAELAGSRVLKSIVGGDWNLEPDDFPMDLVQGTGLH
eukprot:5841526-Amphidinium_carterae.1